MADPNSKGGRVPKRHEIPDAYKWRLEDIFESDEAWEREFARIKELIPSADRFKGKVGASAENLFGAFELVEEIKKRLYRLVAYAAMKRDEDNQVSKYQAMAQRAYTLAYEAQSAFSYLEPEILATPEDVLRGYLASSPEYKVFEHALDSLLRSKEHVLSAREEEILAQVNDLAQEPETIFTMLNDADMRFGTVVDENGRKVELTQGRYQQLRRSPDRRVRREAFEKLYERYIEHKNTLAATYNASVKADVFFSRIRRYPSSLAAKLHPDNLPVSVYENLIAAVRANLAPVHRYFRLRREILGVDELHVYDMLAPLVRDVSYEVPYEEAKKIIKAGLYPLGEAYASVVDQALAGGWIDVYENEGKSSGAYERQVYGVHPYILLNYHNTIDDVFTLAHELGHAVHSYFSAKRQPFIYSDYAPFLAEVASTVNTVLLVNYLLDSEPDPKRRLYVLTEALDGFWTSVVRQTLFAEFEKFAHERVEAGEPLTVELLSREYRRLNEEYYGAVVHIDDQIEVEWTRIPHFYHSFYVYQYATGFAAANAIAQTILSGKEEAVQRYLDFLSAGSSDYPLNVLARAGVDMTSPDPINEAFAMFDRLVEEAEALTSQFGLRL